MGVLEKGRLLANSMMPVALLMVPGEPKPTQGTSSKVRPAFARAARAVSAMASATCSGLSTLVFEVARAMICVVFVHNADGNVGAAQVDSEIIHSPLLLQQKFWVLPNHF